jgi:transposase
MMNIIAFDIASEVSTVCILSKSGKIVKEDKIPTKIVEFRRVIKSVARPRKVVFEEGTQAAWLWSELNRDSDEILVCDPRQNKQLSGQFKCDENDTRNLALRAHANLLKPVWHGGHELQCLREAVRMYQSLVEDAVRLKNQIRAVFRGNGIKGGRKAYSNKGRKAELEKLRFSLQKERVTRLGEVLDEVEKQRAAALKTMVKYARKNIMYKAVRSVDGIGPIFASMSIAEIGDPHRFRTRSQLWSYAGLAIMTYKSSEFELKHGRIVRKHGVEKTRGLVKAYNRTLKYVLKQAAMTLSRTKWSTQYQKLLGRSKNANNALLTLARKLATVLLHVAKTGEQYDIAKVFKAH